MNARDTMVLPIGDKVPTQVDMFYADVIAGLSASPRVLPARWLYDHAGSNLFEDITRIPEYYLTRVERSILTNNVREMAELTGPGRALVEFGSGSSSKTKIVLSSIAPSAYVPIDIAGDFMSESIESLSMLFPSLPIHPVVGDFMKPLDIPNLQGAKCLGFFPGSTIGNLIPNQAVHLLSTMALSLGWGAQLLIGIDRVKDQRLLLPAYDDAQGVTADFNLNLLRRINRELGGDVPIDAFRHEARWNEVESRIEMHLVTTRDVSFSVYGAEFKIDKGETIHTENSTKYGSRDAQLLLRAGGWTPIKEWTDPAQMYSVFLAEATPPRLNP